MKKIVVFGDSYAQFEQDSLKNWVLLLGQKLQLPVINYGHSGSALGYALDQFIKYYQSSEYSSDDIVIFVATNDTRIYVSDMPHPGIGWAPVLYQNGHPLASSPGSISDTAHEWLKDNGKSAAWAIENLYMTELNYEFVKILCFLKTWAQHCSLNTMIVVPSINLGEHPELIDIPLATSNFFPLLTFPLLDISNAEFSNNELHEYACYKMAEKRANHLSAVNRKILAQIIATIIETHDISSYKIEAFSKKLYSTLTEYENYKD